MTNNIFHMGQRASVSLTPYGTSMNAWLTKTGLYYATAQALLAISAVHYALSCIAVSVIYVLGAVVLSPKLSACGPSCVNGYDQVHNNTQFTDVLQSIFSQALVALQDSNSTDTGLIDDYFVLYCNAIWCIFVIDAVIQKSWSLSGPLLFVSLSSIATSLSTTNEFTRPDDERRALSITSWDSSAHLSVSATLVVYSSSVLIKRLSNKLTTLIMHIYLSAYWVLIIATRRSSFIAACTSFLLSIALHHVSDKVRKFGKSLERGTYINGVSTQHPDDRIHATPVVRLKPRVDDIVMPDLEAEEEEDEPLPPDSNDDNLSMSPARNSINNMSMSPLRDSIDHSDVVSTSPARNSMNSSEIASMFPVAPKVEDITQSCSTDSLLVSPPLQDSLQDH